MTTKPKSAKDAKKAFVMELERRGFEDVKITKSSADVTARFGGVVYYFEIKYTSQKTRYSGTATLTDWHTALANEERYWFVVALRRDGLWRFHEYTVSEFMEFSYVPPFKILFDVPVGGGKATSANRDKKRIPLTRERATQMHKLLKKFQSSQE